MYDIEFGNMMESIDKEFYEAKLSLESVHPIDIINNKDSVLTEAITDNKKLMNAFSKIIKVITDLTDKFRRITNKLEFRNRKIVDKYSKFNINGIDIKNDFEYEMFPYWEGYERIKRYHVPRFDNNNLDKYLTNGAEQFKSNDFQRGTFSKEDGSVNANYFRGCDDRGIKEKISGNNVKMVYQRCLEIIKTRKQIADKISAENKNIIVVASNGSKIKVPISESVMMDQSMFKDEYYDILYENILDGALFEDSAATTTDIEKEEKNGGINNNPEENNKANVNKDLIEAIKVYSNICMQVNSKIMNILDEAYDQSVRFCGKISSMQ